MDDLTDSYGRLSTTAKEWKPPPSSPSASSSSMMRQSSSPTSTTSNSYNAATTKTTATPLSPSPISPRPISSVLHQSPPGRTTPAMSTRNATAAASRWQLEPRNKEWVVPSTGAMNNEFVPGKSWNHVPLAPLQQVNSWGHGSDAQISTGEGNRGSFSYGEDIEPVETSVPAGPDPLPPIRSLHTMGLSDDLWLYHKEISYESQREMDPSDPRHKAVPLPFTNAYPLDGPNESRTSFGYPTAVFKVASREDGHLYCIRRVDNTRVSFKIAGAVSERWTTAVSAMGTAVVDHSGLVRFHRCFVANRAVFFLYNYYPGARTLLDRFLDPNNGGGLPFPESVVWSCVTQLVSAIRAVHSANLACRSIQLNHILCHAPDGGMGRIRLRINCIGVIDALEFETRKALGDLQVHDVRDLGYVIMSLAAGTEVHRGSDTNIIRRCDMFIAQNFSRELHSLLMQLLIPTLTPPSIFEICSSIASHAFDELDSTFVVADRYEYALASEYDSGRALRLLLKLGFVNERPEFLMNRRWTESGDCYVLKLFRDYVFHQADGAGHPVMDQGHVVTALNKLDAADEEKIVLTSRDGKTMLVVSFADVARSLESAYSELCSGSVLPSSLQY